MKLCKVKRPYIDNHTVKSYSGVSRGLHRLVDGVSSLRCGAFQRRKAPKVLPRGHPLGIPKFTGVPDFPRTIQRPAHPRRKRAAFAALTRYIEIVGTLFLCFGVPGTPLLCTEVCCTLGQRQLFASPATDGLRAGRPQRKENMPVAYF